MKVTSPVLITVCGQRLESTPLQLRAEDSDTPFMPGETDEFVVSIGESTPSLQLRIEDSARHSLHAWNDF